MKNTQRVGISGGYFVFPPLPVFKILILCIKAIKSKIYKKIQSSEKVTDKKLSVTWKIV